MISQVVFDLPIEGPFDYLIPEALAAKVTVGMRVKVLFGPRAQIGFVTGLLEKSDIAKLKPVLSLCDSAPIFNHLDLSFARGFSAYYGCSLGEALATMLRNKGELKPCVKRDHKPQITLYRCVPGAYAAKIQKIIDEYRDQYKDTAGDYCRFLILVPDTFRHEMISQGFNSLPLEGRVREGESVKIGTRSAVFESDGSYDCVMMIDDEDSSYKQEQTPMYETRQVLLERSRIYGFDIVFVGVSPSVELMELVRENQIKLIESAEAQLKSKVVDLTNYKFIPGLLSPPVRDAVDAALKAGKKSILVLNRRGSYRLTRCVDCAEILKCSRCDSSLIYSRSEGKFLCRHCTTSAPGDTVCPNCHKPSWKSMGIGVEQVQTELKKQFPQAKIASFERASESLDNFDILVATNAVLRFQGRLKVQVAALIDFDAEINRLDMRSAFNALSLVLHVASLAQEGAYIQTRNNNHYVLKYLSKGDIKGFYQEELGLRKELGFSPFKHWVKMSWRGKDDQLTREVAQTVYKELSRSTPEGVMITPPLADAVGRKRDQFRMNVMLQTDQIPQCVAFIKQVLSKLKRRSKVIMALNIDP